MAQLSTSAFFRPKCFHSTPILIPYDSERIPSSAQSNIICPHDINVQYLLFAIARFAKISPLSSEQIAELEMIKSKIHDLRHQYIQQPETQCKDRWTIQFRALTLLALATLQIYHAIVSTKCLTSRDPEIQAYFQTGLEHLKKFETISKNTGDVLWIFTILLCTANTKPEFEQICAKVDEIRAGLWGSRLEYLTSLLRTLKSWNNSKPHRIGKLGETILNEPDNLILVLGLIHDNN